jgi:hypothetical protein
MSVREPPQSGHPAVPMDRSFTGGAFQVWIGRDRATALAARRGGAAIYELGGCMSTFICERRACRPGNHPQKPATSPSPNPSIWHPGSSARRPRKTSVSAGSLIVPIPIPINVCVHWLAR